MGARLIIDSLVENSDLYHAFVEFKAQDGDDPKKLGDLLQFLQSKFSGAPKEILAKNMGAFKETLPRIASSFKPMAPKSPAKILQSVGERKESYFTTEIVRGEEEQGIKVDVRYDYESIGEGDADFNGRKGIAVWIEDVLWDGQSILDTLSKEQIEELEVQAHKLVIES